MARLMRLPSKRASFEDASPALIASSLRYPDSECMVADVQVVHVVRWWT